MMIKSIEEATSSNLMTHVVGQELTDKIATVKRVPTLQTLSSIVPAIIIHFIVLFIVVSVISAPYPAFSTDKPEDHMIFITGFEAYQQKNYDTALLNFKKLLDKYPDTPLLDLAMFWIARTYYKMGNQMEAARHMSQLMKQYPDTPLRGVIENEFLELVARYDNGERLPTKTAKADNKEPSTPIASLVSSTLLSPAPTANNNNVKDLAADAKKSPPTLTVIEKPSETAKHNVAPNISEDNTVAMSSQNSETPAAVNTESKLTPPVPLAQIIGPAAVANTTNRSVDIKGILVGETFIDIVTGNSLNAYKAIKLTHPDRLVIDIPGARSSMAAKSISINRLGISKVRTGINPDAVRIVLDAAQPHFPSYNIKPFASGLRITVAPLAASIPGTSAPVSIINNGKPINPDPRDSVPKSNDSRIRSAILQQDKDLKSFTKQTVVNSADEDNSRSVSTPYVSSANIEQTAPAATRAMNGLLIKKVVVGDSFIDIITDNRLNIYKALKLSHPNRLAIDIPGAKSLLATKSISINHLGISKVRIGIYPDAVRIVLDAAQTQFPMYDIKPTESGLRINIDNTHHITAR